MHELELFTAYLSRRGLKLTAPRLAIMQVFSSSEGHLSPEDLYKSLKEKGHQLGQATVYRTLKLLTDAGLAREVHFNDGPARYERKADSHHDHLLCNACGINLEVMDPRIEALQEELAKQNGFLLTGHRMYLYGLCGNCRKAQAKPSE